jgi:TPR repeat protein
MRARASVVAAVVLAGVAGMVARGAQENAAGDAGPSVNTARVEANVEHALGVYRARYGGAMGLDGEVEAAFGARADADEPDVNDANEADDAGDAGAARIEAALADLEPHLTAARQVAQLHEQEEALTAWATLNQLRPLLGDLSLPESPELWLAAGELANKADDTQLVALAAAMVCRTHDVAESGRALRVVMGALEHVSPGDIRTAARERAAIVGYYRRALDGEARAMGEVGKRYSYSSGVPRDREHALRWWRRGAEAGDGQSMERVGAMYLRGEVVEEDRDLARQWYERAAAVYLEGAEAGDADAMYHLSRMYRGGLGVEKDQAAGRAWLERAAKAGSGWAGHTLAMGQHNGQFEDMTAEEAAQWDRMAAETGFMLAINTMAWRYLEGHGVERDEEQAMDWYRKAARRGSEHAREALEKRGLGW